MPELSARDRLVVFLATGFGVGRLPVAPGTAGSVLGVGYWWLLTRLPTYAYFGGFAIGCALAVWWAGAAAQILQQTDPPSVVIDEIAAMPLALAGVALDLRLWQVIVAFLLFRLFDIWKPSLIGRSQKLPGGIGIVADDLLAAACACAITQGAVAVVHLLGK